MISADDNDVIYRVDNTYYEDLDESSDDDDMIIDAQQHQEVPNMKWPPSISTGGFDASILDDDDDEEEGEEVVISDLQERHVHFQDPKRYHHQTPPYPVQSLRTTTALEHEKEDTNKVDATPAFLRRARDTNANTNINTAHVVINPNTLSMLRDNNTSNNNADGYNTAMPDSSFYGADASALDGTFVSIRDLNDDDDVPSIDNEWNNSTFDRQSDVSSGFPTETTSLLQQHHQQQQQQQQRNRNKNNKQQLPWQGGFFGSQVEKEDRRVRRKMVQKRGWFHGLVGQLRSKKNEMMMNRHNNHPTGDDFTPRRQNNNNFHKPYYQPRSPLSFSTFLICALCFHIGLCGVHDLFMRYLSYRNPDEAAVEAETSWNGEGTYIPAYWLSSEGMIHNPLIGPGARTLTAFGALVPGIVLSKGQRWRFLTALFETSSCLQLALQIWALKTVVGGSAIGLERTRGTFFVALLYLVSALIGSVWSMALEPGRLVTSSEMGTAGLLAGAIMQQMFTSDSRKDDDGDDAADFGSHRNQHGNGNGSNVMATASNEQFTFQPVVPKKKRRVQFNVHSPFFMVVLQVILSWLSAYSSLIGAIAAAGASCALLLLVGATTRNGSSQSSNNDLSFSESVPPPPPPTRFDDEGWNDDESTDTSVGADGKHAFHTPLMRRSILADDDDEEEPLGSRSSLRKRKGDTASSSATPRGLNGHLVRGKPINAYQVLSRFIGILMATILSLIPVVLIASSGGISNELTRAAVLGCKPMRIVYQGDSGEESFECAGGCVPLSLVRVAQRKESMKAGRCDDIAYRCWQQAGTMTLRNYEVDVGIYAVPSADGICSNVADTDTSNYVTDEGEAVANNGNDGEAQQDKEQ